MLPKAVPYSRKTQTIGVTVAGDTEITVENVGGFISPILAAGEDTYLVLHTDQHIKEDSRLETVKLIDVDDSGPNVFTVERNQSSTTGEAQEWPDGTYIFCPLTAEGWERLRADLAGASLATPDTLIRRDGDGRARVNDPDNVADIANKGYVDNIRYANAGAHNSIYRGKYLGDEYTVAQSAVVAAGTFDDLYIGDYWTINGVNWRIAAFDYFYNVGDVVLDDHHAVIVPDTSLASARMEATNITTNGYVGSEMRVTTLPTATTGVIAVCKAAFPGKVIQHRQLLCNASSGGLASGWAWTDCEVELMNEAMVYGTVAWGVGGGTSGYNVASSNGRLPLFALRHDLMHIRASYWLRDVVSATTFAIVHSYGAASGNNASSSLGVRPAFSIS
jgi:hypothetical protein